MAISEPPPGREDGVLDEQNAQGGTGVCGKGLRRAECEMFLRCTEVFTYDPMGVPKARIG